MNFVSVRDLRGKLSEIWKRIAVEKDLVITSNGHPIAILSKVSESDLEESLIAIRQARAVQAVESMQVSSVKKGLHRTSLEEINTEIKAVRKARKS